jgi:hypothetical protein
MSEVTIEIETGPVRPLPVPATVSDKTLITGKCRLYGWSLGDASAAAPAQNTGSAVAPAAGATIASITGVSGGSFDVKWTVELTGAAAAADLNNFVLTNNAGNILASVNPAAAGTYPQQPAEATMAFADTVSVKAIGAGTAGVTYTATIELVPQTRNTSVIQLLDGGIVLAVIDIPPNGSDTKWFGPMGIHIASGIAVHPNPGFVVGSVYAHFHRES